LHLLSIGLLHLLSIGLFTIWCVTPVVFMENVFDSAFNARGEKDEEYWTESKRIDRIGCIFIIQNFFFIYGAKLNQN